MSESKDHQQNIDSSGALDLTFALRMLGLQGSERQIRSTGAIRICAMPERSFPIRYLAPVLLLSVAAALGGCSGGDFGRARDDVRNDDMHRWIGAEATSSVGLRPSQFQLTDLERQLRDLAYPLIEPPLSRPAWKSVFGDYQRIAAPWRQSVAFDRTAYGRTLIDEPHRSHSSRYSQLIDDVRDDITRFEQFFASAIHVIELDRKRNASLKLV